MKKYLKRMGLSPLPKRISDKRTSPFPIPEFSFFLGNYVKSSQLNFHRRRHTKKSEECTDGFCISAESSSDPISTQNGRERLGPPFKRADESRRLYRCRFSSFTTGTWMTEVFPTCLGENIQNSRSFVQNRQALRLCCEK